MKRTLLVSSLLLACSLVASDARAITVDLRDAAFASADTQTSFMTVIDGVTVTFSANPSPGTLYHDTEDGLGVRLDYEMDEIEGVELLVVSFSSPVLLEELQLTDLYNEDGYLESGYYDLDGASLPTSFSAQLDQVRYATNGEKTLAIGSEITSFSLSAHDLIAGQNHDFSLGGLSFSSVTPVPEPSSLSLFAAGAALIAVAVRRSRRS